MTKGAFTSTDSFTIGDLRLFSTREIAERFNLTEQTIKSYIKSGQLRARKLGHKYYVTENDLRAYFEVP